MTSTLAVGHSVSADPSSSSQSLDFGRSRPLASDDLAPTHSSADDVFDLHQRGPFDKPLERDEIERVSL